MTEKSCKFPIRKSWKICSLTKVYLITQNGKDEIHLNFKPLHKNMRRKERKTFGIKSRNSDKQTVKIFNWNTRSWLWEMVSSMNSALRRKEEGWVVFSDYTQHGSHIWWRRVQSEKKKKNHTRPTHWKRGKKFLYFFLFFLVEKKKNKRIAMK